MINRTAFLCILVACSSSKDAPSATGSGGGGGGNAPAASTAPLPSKLDCNNIVAPEMRTKYFANLEVRDHPESISSTGECQMLTKDGALGTLNVSCRGKTGRDIAPSIKLMKKTFPGAEDLAGVGRAALIMHDPTLTFVATWDDDSPCEVTMRLPNAIDAVAFAKDLIAYLPPK